MLIWKLQSKQQQGFPWCAESNMQKSEQEVSKDSSWFPFTFHSKRSGLQVSPFLLNTCEPCVLGHHQCVSTPSPVGFLHLRKNRDDLNVYTWSLTADRIPCRSYLPTCQPVCCWNTSHELINSQWHSVQYKHPSTKMCSSTGEASTCRVCCHELWWISWSLTVLYTFLKAIFPWT